MCNINDNHDVLFLRYVDQYSWIGGKMKIQLEKPAVNSFKAYGWQKRKTQKGAFQMKNYVDKWVSNSNLLPISKEEQQTEVISRLSFTFVAHKLQKH